MGRAPCCDKANVKRGPWSPEEDEKLKEFIDKYGTGGNWISLPQKAGLRRCGKSCRLRWLNYLRPNIKHGQFSDDEDKIICTLFANIGSRWSVIAAQLPGRTDNDIKNYWNTKLKKKLMGVMHPKKPHQSTNYLSLLPLLQTPSPSNPLNPSNVTSANLQTQYSHVGPMQNYQTSCSSSDGSISFGRESDYDQYGGVLYNGINESQKIVFSNEENVGGFFEQKTNGFYGETPLEYLEEIKQMVCTNSCNNMNFFGGENKRGEEGELMYY